MYYEVYDNFIVSVRAVGAAENEDVVSLVTNHVEPKDGETKRLVVDLLTDEPLSRMVLLLREIDRTDGFLRPKRLLEFDEIEEVTEYWTD